eukprot:jgi/Psemu1/42961/gm1.42961_g
MSKETSKGNAQDDAKSANDIDRKKKVSWGKGKPQGKNNYDKKDGRHPKKSYSATPYAGRKYTMSEAASLENGAVTLVGYTEPLKYKDEPAFKKLSYSDQESWNLDMRRWNKANANLKKNLSACYASYGDSSHLLSVTRSERMFEVDRKWAARD